MSPNYLAIYLNDHLAGATMASELARRAASSNRGTPLGEHLEKLAGEIGDDRQSLIEAMRRLGVSEDRLKVTAAWAAEKVGRLKPNGQLTGYSPLSRVVELEILNLGITAKLELWRTLAGLEHRRLAGFDLERLIKRAEGQRRALARQRKAASEATFAPEAAPAP